MNCLWSAAQINLDRRSAERIPRLDVYAAIIYVHVPTIIYAYVHFHKYAVVSARIYTYISRVCVNMYVLIHQARSQTVFYPAHSTAAKIRRLLPALLCRK